MTIPWSVAALASVVIVAILIAWRSDDNLVNSRELVIVAKLLFVFLATLLLIAVRNSIDLPAEQFIYGRF